MTLKIDLADLRARVARRRQQRADRAAALRDQGIALHTPLSRRARPLDAVARILPWRRRED